MKLNRVILEKWKSIIIITMINFIIGAIFSIFINKKSQDRYLLKDLLKLS